MKIIKQYKFAINSILYIILILILTIKNEMH